MEEDRLLVKVALLYYKYDFNQPAISEKLGLSRQKVGRMLKKAREEGIVTIKIKSELSISQECSARLEELYNLKEAVVVDVPINDPRAIKEEIGKAASDFLKRVMINGDSLSISWSSTVYQCILNLKNLDLERLSFSQLNGSNDKVSFKYSGMNILNILNQSNTGSVITPLLAPMIVTSSEVKKSLYSDENISNALISARNSRIALFGIGSISDQSSLYEAGYLDEDLVGKLKKCGAVADVCGHFIDKNGSICDPKTDERVIALSEEEIKKKKISIAVAGDRRKVNAIFGVLNGGWCNVLITDLSTAQELISIKEKG